MNDENTRILNEGQIQNPTPENKTSEKKNSGVKTAAAAGGGFVAGAAVGAAGGVMASNRQEDVAAENTENTEDTAADQEHKIPQPEQVILANNEGIRFAHVDADNFEDAFTQAREQVGPGGAFEFEGKIYATYYGDEWDKLSNEEKAEFQSKVTEIMPQQEEVAEPTLTAQTIEVTPEVHVHHHHTHTTHHHTTHTHVAQNEPMGGKPMDTHHPEVPETPHLEQTGQYIPDVHVVGTDSVYDEDGNIMNVALLESEGDQALMVDVNNDGIMNVLIHDDNYNNNIEENEIHDITDQRIQYSGLQALDESQPHDYLTSAPDDNMSDYVNDADLGMEV